MQANIQNSIFLPVASEAYGINFIDYLEASNNVSKNAP